jgi:hypothetical protein
VRRWRHDLGRRSRCFLARRHERLVGFCGGEAAPVVPLPLAALDPARTGRLHLVLAAAPAAETQQVLFRGFKRHGHAAFLVIVGSAQQVWVAARNNLQDNTFLCLLFFFIKKH